jgi:hypothetical protein
MLAPMLVASELTELFEVPLWDLGEFDARLDGILCPELKLGVEKVGITDQFLGDAATYHARYSNSAHFSRLFKQAFAAAEFVPATDCTVLDIGTRACNPVAGESHFGFA